MAATTCSVTGIENLLGKAGLDTPIPEYPGADIVHNPQDIFRVYLADTLQKLVNCDRLVAYDAIQTSNITGMGDLVIVAPKLRLKDVKAEQLAKDLLQRLPRTPPFGCPLLDGIRLQVYFSPNTLSRLLLSYISDRSTSYGYDTSHGLVDPSIPDGPKKKLLVEFSSPNMASEFQVSHLRSTLIGTYIANIHSNMGWDVVKMNYLGDWGKQIGLLAAGWQRFGSEDKFAKQPLRHLLEVNHKIQDLFKPELEECKTAKANKQDVTEIESRGLYAERDIFFKKMEDREPEAIAVWQRFRDATVRDYTDSYAQLGVTFDEYSGESQVTAESINEVEQILKDKGIYEEHEDSWKIDFSKHDAKGLSLAVLRYRNGTTSYLLRDLAAVFDRYKKHKFDKMIYVVAMEQEMHFHRVTKTLELMGRQDLAERIQHIPFAKINGLPEELKGAALLSDYIDGCRSMVHTSLNEEEEESLHMDSSENSVNQLGLAGLFIQDHSHKRNTSYAVDPKKSGSLEGETGAAIQNCYARLLKKLQSGPSSFDYTTLDHASLEEEDYAELLRILLQYPDAAHGSFRTLEPSFIVVYLLRIADQLTATLDDDDEKDWTGLDTANEARYALYENARQVFENALRLLGVSPWSP
ncbi:arginyl-tRNA synthetase [Fusarium oxysporum f. sp. raphani 54005]|uniref:arginine--tRNA ligase n=3 Tax=Fusarium oxysporum TaxID=5507 RepID=X0CZQ7_FUSOX|nr:arginyl-tRNA synthetase [Fusarium oxysporum f. sp. pisi HDV247]EXK96339.1 arginyl-tRNA synthetase [Fusarium oxysporum f. sp. raphani 54005]KAG7437145.1 putative arginine--tRNA ligase [Fusarium oxysporum f. sp. raphani]